MPDKGKSINFVLNCDLADEHVVFQNIYDVEQAVIDKFHLKRRPSGMKVYKLAPVGFTETISETDKIVVECPQLHASFHDIENTIQQQLNMKHEILSLQMQNETLLRRLHLNEKRQHDSVRTISRLHAQMSELASDLHYLSDDSMSSTTSSPLYPNSLIRGYSHATVSK